MHAIIIIIIIVPMKKKWKKDKKREKNESVPENVRLVMLVPHLGNTCSSNDEEGRGRGLARN